MTVSHIAAKRSYFLSPSPRSDDLAAQALELDGGPEGMRDLAVALLAEYRNERRAILLAKQGDGLALIRDFQAWARPRVERAVALSCDASIVEWGRQTRIGYAVPDTACARLSRIWG